VAGGTRQQLAQRIIILKSSWTLSSSGATHSPMGTAHSTVGSELQERYEMDSGICSQLLA
jgi:hypothetical protein